jgi:hypothetical protein
MLKDSGDWGAPSQELLRRVKELERQGKQTWDDLEKKAEVFYEAAQIRKALGHKEAELFCLANYYYALGLWQLQGQMTEATVNLWRAVELFIELEIESMALQALNSFMYSYVKCRDFTPENLDKVEYALGKIGDFSKDKESLNKNVTYLRIKFHLAEQKSIILRKKKTLESLRESLKFHEEAIQLAKCLNRTEWEERLRLHLTLVKIKIAKLTDKSPIQIAQLYFEAAELSRKRGSEKSYLEHLSDAYKYLALHSIDQKNYVKFFNEIEKALNFAKQSGNESSYWFCLGIKQRVMAELSKEIAKKLKHLNLAKEYFYKSGDVHTGKIAEYYINLTMANNAMKKGDLKSYLQCLEEITKISKALGYNVAIFEMEKARIDALMQAREGNLQNAAKMFKAYVQELSRVAAGTLLHERMSHIQEILDYLSRSFFTKDDVVKISSRLEEVYRKRLGLFLFDAYSLLNVFVSMHIYNMLDDSVLRNLQSQVIQLIVGQEEENVARRDLAQLKYLSQYEWYLKYPEHIVYNYENFEWFLLDCPADLKEVAFDQFYRKVLEPLLHLIVEYNGKLEWKEKWEKELQQYTGDFRPIEKYTLGLLVKCLEYLKKGLKNHCCQLSEKTLALLNEHVEIRNKLTHHMGTIDEISLTEKIRQLLFELRVCTPILLCVLQRRGYGYRANILWGHFPRQVQLTTEEILQENMIYYTSPFVMGKAREIQPDVLISAKQGYEQYKAFLEGVGRFSSLANYKEQLYIREEIKPLTRLRELAEKVATKIIDATEKDENFCQTDFEDIFYENGQMGLLKLLITSPQKLMDFLWNILKISLRKSKERTFRTHASCFKICLMLLESYFGSFWKNKMISQMQHTVAAMFRNMIVGGRGAGRYMQIKSKKDLVDLLGDFDNHFKVLGIRAPSLQEIKREVELYILTFFEGDKKKVILRKVENIFADINIDLSE